MTTPTKPGFYWAKSATQGWIVVRVQVVYRDLCAMETGQDWSFMLDDYEEWGERIQREGEQ